MNIKKFHYIMTHDKTLSDVFQYEMFIKHWDKTMKKTLKELKEFRELKKEGENE